MVYGHREEGMKGGSFLTKGEGKEGNKNWGVL